MKRVWSWLLPAGVLVAFALALNTGEVLKRPLSGPPDDIAGGLVRLEARVSGGDWAGAPQALDQVARAMDLVRPRIELSTEWHELERFREELALLRGSLAAQDPSASLQHIALLKLLYEELGR